MLETDGNTDKQARTHKHTKMQRTHARMYALTHLDVVVVVRVEGAVADGEVKHRQRRVGLPCCCWVVVVVCG